MTRPRFVSYAVVTGDDPVVVMAEDETVLTRAVALEIVAQSRPEHLRGHVDGIKRALLDERWVDAVELWMEATGQSIDAYPTERVWDEGSLDAETAPLELRMKCLFAE